MHLALAVVVTTSLTMLVMPRIPRWFSAQGWTTVNFRGQPVASGCGLIFAVILLAGLVIAQLSWQVIVLVAAVGFAGWIDDRQGDHRVSGYRGHLLSALHGRPTTGMLKIVLIGTTALLVTAGSPLLIHWIVGASLVALGANTINSFDLRPGRAVKAWLLLALVLLSAATRTGGSGTRLLVLLGVVVLIYLPYELRALLMMGDAGANLLGAALGFIAWQALAFRGQLLALGLLACLQVLAEVRSINDIIRANGILRWVDNLGVVTAAASHDDESPRGSSS